MITVCYDNRWYGNSCYKNRCYGNGSVTMETVANEMVTMVMNSLLWKPLLYGNDCYGNWFVAMVTFSMANCTSVRRTDGQQSKTISELDHEILKISIIDFFFVFPPLDEEI